MKMLKLYLTALITFLFLYVGAQGWDWAIEEGGSAADEAEIVDVDKDGNVIIAGKFSGSFSFGPGSLVTSQGGKDIFVAKYSAMGMLLWVKTAGGFQDDEGLSVTVDEWGNVFTTGYFQDQCTFDTTIVQGVGSADVFIASYNRMGILKWVQTGIGPGNNKGKGIATDANGNVLVTGYYYDSCYFGNKYLKSQGEDNVFLVQYDSSGNFIWAIEGGGPSSAWASSVSVDGFNNAYITGSFKDTASFGGHQIMTYGGNDVFLLKADSSGQWLFARNYGGIDNDYGNGLEVDVFDRVAVTGSFFQTVNFPPASSMTSHGAKDGFVGYFDTNGDCIWAKNMGGASDDKGIGVSTDMAGNVYVTGFVNGITHFNTIVDTGAGGDDIFIAKYSQNGMIQSADLAGGVSNEYGKGMKTSVQGVSYITGYFESNSWFDTTLLVGAGNRDIYLAKYYDGSPLFVVQPQDADVCIGDTLTFSVQVDGTGPFSYLWFDQAGSILGAVNSSYSINCNNTNLSGQYHCEVSSSSGWSVSNTAELKVNPLPIAEISAPDSLFYSDSVVINVATGYDNYLWSDGQTASHIWLSGSSLGYGWHQVWVMVETAAGCQASDTIDIFIFSVGIDDPDPSPAFSIFPNPVMDYLNIISHENVLQEISLFDLCGRKLINIKGQQNSKVKEVINTSQLDKGLYILKLSTINKNTNQEYSTKIIKQ